MVWLAGAMRRAFARNSSPTGFFLLLLAGGLNLYMLWPTGRPGVYETAILAGQFFLLGGLLALFYAVRGPVLHPVLALVGSACLTLAVGSRVTLAVVVGWLVLAVAWRALALGRGDARRMKLTLSGLLLPLLFGGVGLMWYNAARFGNAFETGIRYQLGIPQFPHTLSQFFSLANILPNLFGTWLRPPLFETQFPFVSVAFVKEVDWPWFIRLPVDYIYHEPQAGWLSVFPLIVLGLVPVKRFLWAACRRRVGRWVGWTPARCGAEFRALVGRGVIRLFAGAVSRTVVVFLLRYSLSIRAGSGGISTGLPGCVAGGARPGGAPRLAPPFLAGRDMPGIVQPDFRTAGWVVRRR